MSLCDIIRMHTKILYASRNISEYIFHHFFLNLKIFPLASLFVFTEFSRIKSFLNDPTSWNECQNISFHLMEVLSVFTVANRHWPNVFNEEGRWKKNWLRQCGRKVIRFECQSTEDALLIKLRKSFNWFAIDSLKWRLNPFHRVRFVGKLSFAL